MLVPDINILVYAYNSDAREHIRAREWWEGTLMQGRPVGIPWVVALGFIRISTNAKSSFNAPMEKARELLKRFLSERNSARIPDDLPALESNPQKSDEVTDSYLAELAARHDMKLATMDDGINHPAAVLL